MMKRTHVSVALLVTSPLIIANPISGIGIVAATIPDIDLLFGMNNHRKLTHSLLALGVSTGFMYVLFPTSWLVWFIAYLSHLCLDSFTKMGIAFFYPFNKKYFGLKAIKSGGSEDKFIALIMVYLIFEWIGSH